MIKQISLKTASFIFKNANLDSELFEVYQFGIEFTISTLLNFFWVISISVVLNDVISGIIFLAVFISLRSFTGGYHAKTYFMCNALFILTYLLVYYINSIITMFFEGELFSRILMSLILLGIIPITAFAPVQHKHKLLSQKQARISQIMGIVVFFLISIMALVLHFNGIIYGSFIIITLTSVSVLILIEVLNPERRKTND